MIDDERERTTIMEEKTDKPLIEQALQDEVKEFAMLKDHKAGLEITLGSCTMPLQNIAGLLI